MCAACDDKMKTGNPSSFSARSSDTVLTARVKTALCRLQIENFSCLDVKVVTEKGVVYLLGLLNRAQEAIAIKTTRSVKGVLKVVKLFKDANNQTFSNRYTSIISKSSFLAPHSGHVQLGGRSSNECRGLYPHRARRFFHGKAQPQI